MIHPNDFTNGPNEDGSTIASVAIAIVVAVGATLLAYSFSTITDYWLGRLM